MKQQVYTMIITNNDASFYSLSEAASFSLHWQSSLMYQIYPKRVILIENRKSKHYHWVLHIRISLGTKFQSKFTVLIFWTKFAQNGYFQPETERLYFSVHPWLLLTILDFSAGGRQTQPHFNFSSLSSCRDSYCYGLFPKILTIAKCFPAAFFIYFIVYSRIGIVKTWILIYID